MASAFAAAGPVDLEALASLPWTESRRTELSSQLAGTAAVSHLIGRLMDEDRPEDDMPSIHEFLLIRITPSGDLALFALLDTPRGFVNDLEIVYRIDGQLRHQDFFVPPAQFKSLASAVVDLDGDGFVEVLVPEALSEYRGYKPIAVIDHVYRWDGQQFVDASASYRHYYEQIALPRVLRRLQEVSADPDYNSSNNEDVRLLAEALELEKRTIESLLGGTP